MKSYKEITYRYLKEQRNRTILTIIGIILSVAMLSAIGTLIISVRASLIKDAIEDNGSYHAVFKNVDKANIDKIINHVGVDKVGLSKAEGTAIVSEFTDEEKARYGDGLSLYRYMEIVEYEEDALKLLPHKIKEGRLPKTSSEIVIDPSIVGYFENKIKIGDKVKLTIGERIFTKVEDDKGQSESFEKKIEKEYTVVGFLISKYRGSAVYETKGFTILDENSPDIGTYNIYITVPSVRNANEQIFSIAGDVGIDKSNINTNYSLLRLSAESLDETFNSGLISLLAFVIILIMVSTIAVIYNAFNISVLERISQFGLLRSVGATPQQIRGIVIKEALILSAIGIPIGLFSGVFAMKIVFYIINILAYDMDSFKSMEITTSYLVFIFGSITGFITVLLSAIGPARKAGKISPMEAVRNTGSFRKETFSKVKKCKIIRKILGIEGEIAYKNLRRNRTRFYITVFSMVISITLFIVFASFSDFVFKAGLIATDDMGDFLIIGEDIIETEKMYKELKGIEDINKVYNVRFTTRTLLIHQDKINKITLEILPNIIAEKRDDLISIKNVDLYTIGDENFESLRGLLKEGTLDTETLDKNNGVLVINNTHAYNEKTDKGMTIEGYSLKSGDKISLANFESGEKIEEGIPEFNELRVMGVLDKGMFGMKYNSYGAFNIITTEKVLDNIIKEYNDSDGNDLFIEMKKDGNIENVSRYLDEKYESSTAFSYIDFAEESKQMRVLGIIMSIFLYGFVTIIALISCINIINTISTNIILRTKEISMIKAVGMTQSGIKRMVALESIYYGISAAIFGGVLGTILTFVLFRIIINVREFQWDVPWRNIAIACIGSTIVALLSGIYPLKRINKNIIVENMKADN